MKTAMIIVSSLTAATVLASACAKVRNAPAVVASMRHVGVSSSQMSRLALIEIAAGAGLLIGLANALIGRLAAIGLILYFFGAVIAHARVRDRFQEMSPALVLALLATVTLVLQVRR